MDKVKCSVCNGSGKRIIPTMIGKVVCPTTQICTRCRGTGKVEK
jgi:DnaJ-class molecular chaperone